MRLQEFYVDGHGYVTRGECLRALIAAIYVTARQSKVFTTNEVFANVTGYSAENLRRATAHSKLVSVALRKARSQGMCETAPGVVVSKDLLSHARQKRAWVSKIHVPTLPTDYAI